MLKKADTTSNIMQTIPTTLIAFMPLFSKILKYSDRAVIAIIAMTATNNSVNEGKVDTHKMTIHKVIATILAIDLLINSLLVHKFIFHLSGY